MVGMKTEKAYRGILETLKGCRKTIEKYRCRDGREPFQVQSTGWGGFFITAGCFTPLSENCRQTKEKNKQIDDRFSIFHL